jgi:23S rRNA pseudouridine1911/1915/1917 synthase
MQETAQLRGATLAAEAAGWRLDRALAAAMPTLSRERLKALVAAGAVEVEGRPERDPARKMKGGEAVCVAIPPARPAEAEGQDIPLDIRYEDEHLLVVEKTAGLVVHPAAGNLDGTLVNALLHHCAGRLSGIGGVARPGIVHRIDKDTSGLLVVAKSDAAHQGLAAQFAAHTVERSYGAIVHGVPCAGDPRLRGLAGVAFEPGGVLRITTQLARHRTDRQRQAVVAHGGRRAVTRARVIENFGGAAALLECRLETGRTHQIRVHLAHVGHGLIGDPVYGGARRLPARALPEGAAEAAAAFPRQALHAGTLGFVHPLSGEALRFEAAMPEDMRSLLAALRGMNDTT